VLTSALGTVPRRDGINRGERMLKLVEVHLREPDRFKSIMINIEGMDWVVFEERCKVKGITPARAISDFIERSVSNELSQD